MKKFISLLTCLMLCFCICFTSNATDTHHSSTASYDLEKGGKQKFTLVNSEGRTVYVTIEQDTSRAVANGTYKVPASAPDAWKAEYNVTISNNRITTLSSPKVIALKGSIINKSLKKESNTQGTLYFSWRYLVISHTKGVRCTLTSSNLKVSVI